MNIKTSLMTSKTNAVPGLHSIFKNNLHAIREICKIHKVKSLSAFGSISSDNFKDESDIDLLVSFESMEHGEYADNYFLVADEFEKLFERSIDLITEKSLSNPYFIQSVNLTKQLIYDQQDQKISLWHQGVYKFSGYNPT